MSDMTGDTKLGFKTSSTQQPGRLGDEFEVTAQAPVVRGVSASINASRITTRWVQNLSGAALLPGQLVTADTANAMDINVRASNATDIPVGIVDPFLTSNVANGESFLIVTRANRIPIRAGAAFAKGARLLPDASGKAVTGAGTAMRALEAATAVDQLRNVSCNFAAQ